MNATGKVKSAQVRRFIEKARELGCDETEAEFEAKLKKIANAQTEKRKPPARRKPAK